MKNKQILFLLAWLSGLNLDLEKSSARRRFSRLLKGYKEDIDNEGDEIRKELCEKNPDGSPKLVDKLYQFSKENRKKAETALKNLSELEIEVNWTGEEKDKATISTLIKEEITKIKEKKEFNEAEYELLALLEESLECLNEKNKNKK